MSKRKTKVQLMAEIEELKEEKQSLREQIKTVSAESAQSKTDMLKTIGELKSEVATLKTKNTALETENTELTEKVKELPKGSIVEEKFFGVTTYELAGKTHQTKAPGAFNALESIIQVLRNQKRDRFEPLGAKNIKQAIRRQVTYESELT